MIQAITDREYRVLAIIDKLRICRTNDLAWLAGYTDYSYCRKGIKKLENMRLIQSERDFSGAKCCFLTSRGLSRIEKATHHPYEISSTTNHALEVSVVCAWLCATKAANIFDMLTDSDLKRMYSKKAHCPDIVYDGIAYEIELNRKKHSVVESNLLANEKFGQQIWIVPDKSKNIRTNLISAAKNVAVNLEIISLETIEHELSNANVHSNVFHKQRGVSAHFIEPEHSTAIKYSSYFQALEGKT